mgnify:FL=1
MTETITGLGLPYMGSKRKLAKKIVDKILADNPTCHYVFDLFGGGGAISFELIQREQIKKVVYNDINTGVVELLKDIRDNGVTDKYYQWVSRETFHKHKNDKDWFGGLCQVVWSFGNGQKTYLFGRDIEEYKKMYFEVVVNNIDHTEKMANFIENYVLKRYGIAKKCKLEMPQWIDINKRRLEIRRQIFSYEKACKLKQQQEQKKLEQLGKLEQLKKQQAINKTHPLQDIKQIGLLERLQQLEQLRQLERLEQIKTLKYLEQTKVLEGLEQVKQVSNSQVINKLELLNQSFDEVKINTPINETIIYLDPPYLDVGAEYAEMVDQKKINDYLNKTPYVVYVSSYNCGLRCIAEYEHRTTLAVGRNDKVIERLYIKQPNDGYNYYLPNVSKKDDNKVNKKANIRQKQRCACGGVIVKTSSGSKICDNCFRTFDD